MLLLHGVIEENINAVELQGHKVPKFDINGTYLPQIYFR